MSKTKTTAEFILQSNEVHNNKYDYSLVDYKKANIRVKIICPIHGVFPQIPANHLRGRGCSNCGDQIISKKLSSNIEEFIQKSRLVHGDKYNYSLVDYKKASIRVKIICPIHGTFQQTPNIHLRGCGCSNCGDLVISKRFISSTDEFIPKAKSIHNDKYDYSLVEYIGSKTEVDIICPTHGTFPQTPNDHLQGNGCPRCTSQVSKNQKELFKFIQSITNIAILEDRINYKPLQLDITIPDKALAIEYNGAYWHSVNYEHTSRYGQKDHLKDKMLKAQELGLRVINIYEDEWQNSRSHIEQIIKKALGIADSIILADECTIWSADNSTIDTHIKPFFEKFHPFKFNYNPESIVCCLVYDGQIQMCAYFGGDETNCELIQYCSRANIKVENGLRKLINYFLQCNPEVKKIKSYCDARLFTGDEYIEAGFNKVGITDPSFNVIIGNWNNLIRKSSNYMLKDKFSSYFDEETLKSKTQMELAADLG